MNAQEANERCVGLALMLSAEMLKNGGRDLPRRGLRAARARRRRLG